MDEDIASTGRFDNAEGCLWCAAATGMKSELQRLRKLAQNYRKHGVPWYGEGVSAPAQSSDENLHGLWTKRRRRAWRKVWVLPVTRSLGSLLR